MKFFAAFALIAVAASAAVGPAPILLPGFETVAPGPAPILGPGFETILPVPSPILVPEVEIIGQEPVSVGPAFIPAPVQTVEVPTNTPLVQIILNINHADGASPVEVIAPEVPPTPVQIVDMPAPEVAPTPVQIVDLPAPTPVQIVDLPAPVPVVNLPGILN